jgi:predicted O-methyltransferase YrrM
MNKAESLNQKIQECLKTYSLKKVEKYFKDLNNGDGRDRSYWLETHSQEQYPQGIYLYLGSVVRVIKPKIIVEIGADRGISALVMHSELGKNGKLYSIDIRDGWEYVPHGLQGIKRLVGDSVDASLFGGLDLTTVDLWFIDGLHQDTTVQKEIDTYSPYWHTGTVVLLDDIDLYQDTWKNIPFDKYESKEIHNSNFGVVVV